MVIGTVTAREKDVTDREELWGGFRRGGEYALSTDLFLVYESSAYAKGPALTIPKDVSGVGRMLYRAPVTFAEYEGNPEQWHAKGVLGVVASGTRVKCVRLTRQSAALWGKMLVVYAEILDGPHAGTIVDIIDLSRWVKGDETGLLVRPDKRLLKEYRPEDGQSTVKTIGD